MPPRGVIGALAAVAAVALSACAPSVIPAGRPVAAPQVAPDRIVASDEAALPLRRWLPAMPARAVIVAAHGFMDYSHAFALPGDAWAKRGIATWAWDQRGFGAAPHRGRWAGTAMCWRSAREKPSAVFTATTSSSWGAERWGAERRLENAGK